MTTKDGEFERVWTLVFGPIQAVDKIGHIWDVVPFSFTLRIWLIGNSVSCMECEPFHVLCQDTMSE